MDSKTLTQLRDTIRRVAREPVPMTAKLKVLLERHAMLYPDTPPTRWLISTRIARQVVAELQPLLDGYDPSDAPLPIEALTQLFGLPVELVTDLPQGAVLR